MRFTLRAIGTVVNRDRGQLKWWSIGTVGNRDRGQSGRSQWQRGQTDATLFICIYMSNHVYLSLASLGLNNCVNVKYRALRFTRSCRLI